MSKLKTTPKKGDNVVAEYVISGKAQKRLNLGTVTKVSKTNKTFTVKDDEGNEVERHYTFGASNGVRLLGFVSPEGTTEETVEETEG